MPFLFSTFSSPCVFLKASRGARDGGTIETFCHWEVNNDSQEEFVVRTSKLGDYSGCFVLRVHVTPPPPLTAQSLRRIARPCSACGYTRTERGADGVPSFFLIYSLVALVVG